MSKDMVEAIRDVISVIDSYVEAESLLVDSLRQNEVVLKLASYGMKSLEASWRRVAEYQDYMLEDGFDAWAHAVTCDIPDMFSRDEVKGLFGNAMREEFERRSSGEARD